MLTPITECIYARGDSLIFRLPATPSRLGIFITAGSDTHLKTKKGADAPFVLPKKLVLIDTQHIEVAIDQLIHCFLFT
ncbi:hypothetical protein EFU51_16670 [Vibrio cholerae]|nr:hypothetical protein [Vibrio cholerae]